MDISINHMPAPVVAQNVKPLADDATNRVAKPGGGFVVTDLRANALDGAEAVSEALLRRDDGLGKLFSAAFNLPPPPMPAFLST